MTVYRDSESKKRSNFMDAWAFLLAGILLLKAHFDRIAGRVVKAKMRIEKIRMEYPDAFEFLDAYYGLLLINEQDIESAFKYLNANLKSLPADKNESQRYIELFCRYLLDAGKEDFDWEGLLTEAHNLKPDLMTKHMLVLPTEERILRSFDL